LRLNQHEAETLARLQVAIEGEEKDTAAPLAAAGTLAGAAGTGFTTYMKLNPPPPTS
jgi:hypothetical protein